MIVFKGFHGNMTCTLGAGSFQYKIGKKATAKEAQTARTGLHSTKEPFGILSYYHDLDHDAFCICEAAGDVNEDEHGRVASTELTPLKNLTPKELAIYEALYIEKHPELDTSLYVKRNEARDNGHFAVVRGKDPKGYGERGTVICLLQEYASSKRIKKVEIFEIDGKENKSGWYGIGGRIEHEEGEPEKTKNIEGDAGDRVKSKQRSSGNGKNTALVRS